MKVNIYTRKKRWKWFLFAAAVLIVGISLWYSNILVHKIANDERNRIRIWAEAIHRKARLVNYTDQFFEKIRAEERKKVELWAEATNRLIKASNSEDITFYSDIIRGNTTIPVILTDENDRISNAVNTEFSLDTVKVLEGRLKEQFTVFKPITINSYGNIIHIYYKESRLFTELRDVLNDLIKSFFTEVVFNSASVPVIVTDTTRRHVLAFGNLDSAKMRNDGFVHRTLNQMASQNTPIEIDLAGQGKSYIFYKDSYLLTQLQYYPFVQFIIIGIFLLIAYLMFSYARRSEQNQVWVGMAKETAHQLGTPLSSIMAWIEILRSRNVDGQITAELEKDINRLNVIAQRFSKIGSAPILENQDIVKMIHESLEYLKTRSSKKVQFILNPPAGTEILVPVNAQLFDWVIENLCKNSLDAMSGQGTIEVIVTEDDRNVTIDVSDTGKGIPKNSFRAIFNPGYTSKKRGWGLGLTLSERIIRQYHKGEIYVKSSALNKGTTFRIVLKK